MDFNYMFPKRMDLHDHYPIYIGCEECEPGHDFGPAIRDFTIIHYVKNGKGKFTSKGSRKTIYVLVCSHKRHTPDYLTNTGGYYHGND